MTVRSRIVSSSGPIMLATLGLGANVAHGKHDASAVSSPSLCPVNGIVLLDNSGNVCRWRTRMRIAIVGAGVSGLVCAHMLHRDHELVVFEASDRAGGHANTVHVETDIGAY